MRFLSIVLCLLCISYSSVASADAPVTVDYKNVVPLPKSIEMAVKTGEYILKQNAIISYDGKNEQLGNIAFLLKDYLKRDANFDVAISADVKKNVDIRLAVGLKNTNPEAYAITVNKKGITITGATERGAFYGMQTLRKAIGTNGGEAIALPYVTINDQPRFSYRGVHLDCSRHFFPVDVVKRYIDIMALHGCNQFHWHITDDQGWRFEVKALPDLIKKASRREHSVIGHNCKAADGEYIYDETPVSGYYTQDQCREIVRYAAERYINVIPEIDLPGHMVAALSVYPELGCTGGPYEVWPLWGVSEDVLCAGNPKTLDFLKTVLGEIADVFPSEKIHIGGDESPRVRWEQCPKCQAKMKELGLSKEAELQTYINKQLEIFMAAKGRTLIGWDEVLEGGLSESAWVMSWRGMEGGIEAARQHHHVIMTPVDYCYFDYYQTEKRHPQSFWAYLPMSKVYSMEPVPSELTADEAKYIMGAQCNLWTEYIVSEDNLQYMLLPRLCAMSEVQWMEPSQKNYNDFINTRLPHMQQIFKRLGYRYGPFE